MKEIIAIDKPKSPISEAYRGIRTNLMFANIDQKIKTILVTSTTPGEGKTTTLANIAAVMSQNNQKVLVLDCDMRKPRIHKIFTGVHNNMGLADLLLKQDDFNGYIQKLPGVDIDIITAGKIPSNPSELLSSNAMKQLLETLKDTYDYIFMDTPPILPVTDAIIMSAYTDGAILVISAGQVDIELVKKAKMSLNQVKANLLGVVLNKVPIEDRKTYQNYYYYYANE